MAIQPGLYFGTVPGLLNILIIRQCARVLAASQEQPESEPSLGDCMMGDEVLPIPCAYHEIWLDGSVPVPFGHREWIALR